MQIQRIVPNLTVTDLDRAVREHTDVLGLQVVMNHGWIVTRADDAGHQLSLMTTDATGPINPDVSIFVDAVQTAYESAIAAGIEILYPLTTEDWGVRRFFYRDSSGRVINVGSHV